MKFLVPGTWNVGAAIGLALTPAGVGADDAAAVSYQDAMACSAMFAFLSASSETAKDEDLLIDMSAQWLVAAMARTKASGTQPDEAELQHWVDALADELDAMAYENAMEAQLFSMIDACEAKQAMISGEFDTPPDQ